MAVNPSHIWREATALPASWRATAMDAPWLTTETGVAKPPRELVVRTKTTEALHGRDAGVYCAEVGGELATSPAQPRAIRRFFQDNAGAARINVAGQLVSAACLARFAGRVAALARESGRGSPTLRAMTAASGGVSSAALATSALTSLALTSRAGRRGADAVALHRGMFLAGGPVHTTAFGVFVGCLSVAGRQSRGLPRGLTTAGFASAVAGALSPLSLAVKPAVLLIPAARADGLLVSGIAGARLGRLTARGAGERG